MTDAELLQWARDQRWFYRFPLPGGAWTAAPDDVPSALHEARRTMLMQVLETRFPEALSDVSALDIACHQGFFSIALAEKLGEVTGLDVNAASLDQASRITAYLGRSNVRYVQADIQECDLNTIPPADVVVMYGLLYHMEDPIRLLRRAASLCRDTLVIETQLTAFDMVTDIEWGDYRQMRSVRGLFALVDDQDNPEGGVTTLATVPSYGALTYLLGQLGFDDIRRVPPPDAQAEQLHRGRRAVIAAHRTRAA